MSPWPRKNVVVPVDFSDESMEALNQALAMVDDPAHVRVVNVLSELSPDDPSPLWGASHRIEEGEKKLAEWTTDFKNISSIVLVGDPGYEITDYAKRVGADLIVLSSHGRTGLKRLLLGSVAERVVRLADCPVLVLRK